MAKATPKIGEINRYKQRLIAQSDDTDDGELPLWVLQCERPDGANTSREPVRPCVTLASVPGSPFQKPRVASRNLSFHSLQPRG